MLPRGKAFSRFIGLLQTVSALSEAKCGRVSPGYRFAHPGYQRIPKAWKPHLRGA